MSLTPIKSCKKYLLSYKDTSNKLHQLGIYALDAYDCLMLAEQFNSFINDHPNSVQDPTKILSKLIMNLKTSPFSIKDNSFKDLDNSSRNYPTLDDLMTEQKIANKKVKTVHRRRDLDSLG